MRRRPTIPFLCLWLLVLAGCDESRPPTNQGGGKPEVPATVNDHSRRDTYVVVQIRTNVKLYFPKLW